MDVSKSDMELLQFAAATDHDIFSEVVFLNLYKLRTTNESCKKPTQILNDSLNSYAFNRDLLYLKYFTFYAATSDKLKSTG